MHNLYEELKVPVDKLRWRLDRNALTFASTDELPPQEEIIGQPRGVQAFRFAMEMNKPGYNVLVTGHPGTGRLEAVKKMLHDIAGKEKAPDDLCYVNNFKNDESPVLLRFKAGGGQEFKNDMENLITGLKDSVPQLFESEEYISRRKEIMEAYEKKTTEFFKGLDKKVKSMGFSLVQVPGGQQRPQLMPVVDGEPIPMAALEQKMENGRFPKDEFDEIRKKYDQLKEEIDKIFLEIRELHKELQEKGRKFDKMMFHNLAAEQFQPLLDKYQQEKIQSYLKAALTDLGENIEIFLVDQKSQELPPGMVMPAGPGFQPYEVNQLVDNSEQKKPPVIIESYPTYRNLFGTIERIVDRSGVWRTDFSKIKAGSFLKANGGYLVLNLRDILTEPGVWPALKRALKTEKMEIQTFDPFYWFTSTGLKPEPIEMEIKIVILCDPYLYFLLHHYDEDVPRIFKVRADFDSSMDKTDESLEQLTRVIRTTTAEQKITALDPGAVASLFEHLVRVSGRQEKISISTPLLTDLLCEAETLAHREDARFIGEKHIEQAVEDRIYRSNLIEEKLQEMIDRGSLLIDTEGAVIGQVNGLAVLDLADHRFGRPSRITATTSMGRGGVINIEREADLGGSIHNKGVLILSGYLRRMYAQDKPLSVSASIAFEQSYSGVDGDSASSTELYALLSSLAGVPVKQGIAVTGSVNQRGEVQAIGGVNEKIEGFFDVCKKKGLSGEQGVLIPHSNIQDMMLRKEVVEAVADGRFNVWAVKTINEGLEILTGEKAGEKDESNRYPEGTINALVDEKLLELAKGLKKFGAGEKNKKEQ
ncbi:MAG: AAA family ATPase [Desulfobulbaceae bacterium]|nr:AAA family ATPase [Desulfobulbaceae bacterium]